MGKVIAQRLLSLVFVIFSITFLTFIVGYLAPGDPILVLLGPRRDLAIEHGDLGFQSLQRRRQAVMDERVVAPRFLAGEVLRDVEALHLAGDLRRERRRVETRDPGDARPRVKDRIPGGGNADADRRNDAQPGHDNATAARWTTFVLRTPVFARGVTRRAHRTTFVLRAPVYALGAALRLMSVPARPSEGY